MSSAKALKFTKVCTEARLFYHIFAYISNLTTAASGTCHFCKYCLPSRKGTRVGFSCCWVMQVLSCWWLVCKGFASDFRFLVVFCYKIWLQCLKLIVTGILINIVKLKIAKCLFSLFFLLVGKESLLFLVLQMGMTLKCCWTKKIGKRSSMLHI